MDHGSFVEYALIDHPELGHMLKDKAQTMAMTATTAQAASFSPPCSNNTRAMRIPHR